MELWIEMIDKFGLPIVIIFGLSVFIVKYIDKKERQAEEYKKQEKEERKEEKEYFISEIKNQREMFEKTTERHAEALDKQSEILDNTVREFGSKMDMIVLKLNDTSGQLEKVETDVSEIKIRLQTRD